MYKSFPPEGTLDPQQPWYRARISDAHWDRFKAKLIGGRDASGTSYFSMVNVSGAEADKIIANMKKDPRGYPQMNQSDPKALYNYQTWVVSEYLGSKPKGPELIDDKDVGKASEGKTTVYKPEDKFVDDKKEFAKNQEEKLDEKLTETSDAIMDAIDEFIAADKKRFEDFKKQQEEERFRKQVDAKIDDAQRERRINELFHETLSDSLKEKLYGKKKSNTGSSQYKSPIGPQPSLKRNPEFGYNQYEKPIGPLPMQGPKQAKKGLIGTREVLNDDQIAKKYGIQKPAPVPAWGNDKSGSDEDDWEGEVQDQLGTKLDALIEQVRSEPLPQPTKTKRRKTKGKKPLGRKKYSGKMGLGGSLAEIQENVVETRKALFELYKLEKERFEFKKKVDAKLTQELSAKLREKDLEKPDKKDKKKKKRKKNILEEAGLMGLIAGGIGLALPLILAGLNKWFQQQNTPPPPMGPGMKGGGLVPSRFKIPSFLGGGKVSGKGPNKDTVPAMLAPGEFVMSRGAVEKYGVETLMVMNKSGGGTNRPTYSGMLPGYAGGGPVQKPKGPKISNADYAALVAISALEDSDPQGRADVAQSLYNRLHAATYYGSNYYQHERGGNNLKSIITARAHMGASGGGQFQPTFVNPQDWYNITDSESAIAAMMSAKGYTYAQASAKYKATEKALSNPVLQQKARSHVGGRTFFLGKSQHGNMDPAGGDVLRNPDDNFFSMWFESGTKYDRERRNIPAEIPQRLQPKSGTTQNNTKPTTPVVPSPSPSAPQGSNESSSPVWWNPFTWQIPKIKVEPSMKGIKIKVGGDDLSMAPGSVPPPPPLPNPRRNVNPFEQALSSIQISQPPRTPMPNFNMPQSIASVGVPAGSQPSV